MKNFNLIYFSFVVLFTAIATPAFARDYSEKQITTVHIGETPTGNTGAECFFHVEGDATWWRIPQGAASATNCELVFSAFDSGKPVSFDVSGSDIQYLCTTRTGSC